MAESTESMSIKELTKKVTEQNSKRDAQLERIANSGTRFAERAQKLIDADKQKLALQGRVSGLSEKRLQKAAVLAQAIENQKEIMEAQKTALEGIDIKAEDNEKFQQEQKKLAKMQLQHGRAIGSADAEDEAKKKLRDLKSNTFLGKISNSLTGILASTKETIKAGLSGFSKFAFGALALAALTFLNNPKFEEIKNTIIDIIVPALAYLYDEIIKPIALYIGGKLKNLFTDLKSYIDGEKGIGTVLMDNIGVVSAIALALGVKVLGFSGMLTGVKGIGIALAWVAKGGPITLITSAATKIGAAFTALKTSLTTAVWPAITAKLAAIKGFFAAKLVALKGFLAGPIAPILVAAAAIGVVLYSLKEAFDDFMFELEATGSIWEATKTGIVSVISNILGLPFDLIKDGVSWIIGKIGSVFGLESFKNASKVMDEFSLVDTIAEGLTFMGDAISGVFDTIVNKIQNIIRSISIPGLFDGDNLADTLFGTTEEQEAAKKAKEEEQKLFEENRKALREQQKLEKEAAEAEKLKKIKEQQAVPKVPIFERLGNPRGAQAPTQNTVINAPNNVNAPTTNTLSTITTSIINTDRVTDKLSIVT